MRLRDARQLAPIALILSLGLVWLQCAVAQDSQTPETHAGFIPTISGGAGYIYHVNGGVPTLMPQINPVLLVPFGAHVLLESRAGFDGSFQREDQTSGPYQGKIFKSVAYAQLDWLANTHVIGVAGRYLLPFGMYNERLTTFWIRNLQDAPITYPIGTRTSGSGDGFMLRGVATQHDTYSIQYTSYFSASSNINQLEAGRVAGGDTSVFFPHERFEAGVSYQRFLQGQNINSVATYIAWQPPSTSLDIKAEGDYSHNGRGYWIEAAYLFDQLPIPSFFRHTQVVGRMQQFYPLNGGGNSLPRVATQRVDFGLNYYVRDDLRFVSSYGRSFSSQANANIWNVGFTYRFMFPLWPARKQ